MQSIAALGGVKLKLITPEAFASSSPGWNPGETSRERSAKRL